MRIVFLASSVVGGLALAFAASAKAAPISGTSLSGGTSAAEKIQYRHCSLVDGRRVCQFVYGYRDRDYGDRNREHDSRNYRHRDRDDRWRWWRGRHDRDRG
jgi:hypothetical protein